MITPNYITTLPNKSNSAKPPIGFRLQLGGQWRGLANSGLGIPAQMKQGTPKQIELIRHRRKVLPVVWRVYVGIVFATFMVRYLLDLHATPLTFKMFAYGFIGCAAALFIFTAYYWRCPVCKEMFSTQSGGKYCERCKTQFDA